MQLALDSAGDERGAWQAVLEETPDEYRTAMEFLVANMPKSDFAKIQPARLMEEVRLAYAAREQVAWGRDIPEAIFLNDVLPYCNIDEPRDPWRQEFYERFIDLAKSCESPGEVAQKLNESMFDLLKVKYSTKRKRANQSPKESIEQGLASCTGLSILLTNACRSVCVPARLVGIAKWPTKNGNHTWVEVWDQGWHFTGAAEPSKDGLDHGWFERDAAGAIKDSPRSSVRAVSYARTKDKWPLVWDRKSNQVSAVNVSDRYIGKHAAIEAQADAKTFECRLVVRDHDRNRVSSVVCVTDQQDATRSWIGHSRDESSDTNDILLLDLPQNRTYRVVARVGTQRVSSQIMLEQSMGTTNLELVLPGNERDSTDKQIEEYALRQFSGEEEVAAPEVHVLDDYANKEAGWRKILWEQYRAHADHQDLQSDLENNRVRHADQESPYVLKEVGERGPNGWPLFIAMHGGGGTRQEVNDSQWRHMQIYYRDQHQLPGYKYLALRAPNNTWNGFYDDYVYPLIHELVRQQTLLNEVDPNRIYIMGYSHGGYGAFAIGPKMPDHFAAIHSSAAAPTDGQSVADTLRNTRFTYMIGAKDKAYGRASRCQKFSDVVESLRGDRKDIFPVEMLWKNEHGHGGLPDRDMIKEMYAFQRDPVPRELTWRMSDSVIKNFYWLSCDTPSRDTVIAASCHDNKIRVDVNPPAPLSVWLDSRLVDFREPVEMVVNGKRLDVAPQPTVEAMVRSLRRRHDPFMIFSCEVAVPAE